MRYTFRTPPNAKSFIEAFDELRKMKAVTLNDLPESFELELYDFINSRPRQLGPSRPRLTRNGPERRRYGRTDLRYKLTIAS